MVDWSYCSSAAFAAAGNSVGGVAVADAAGSSGYGYRLSNFLNCALKLKIIQYLIKKNFNFKHSFWEHLRILSKYVVFVCTRGVKCTIVLLWHNTFVKLWTNMEFV